MRKLGAAIRRWWGQSVGHLWHRLTDRLSIRTRLTLVYSSLFTFSTVIVIGGLAIVVSEAADRSIIGGALAPEFFDGESPPASSPATSSPSMVRPDSTGLNQVTTYTEVATANYLKWSVIALVVMTVFSILVGWIVAGRVLAPVHELTDRARRMSADNLGERFAASGPRDELHTLADTFDAMLDRIEQAFVAERTLIANISHELRTPLATQRAILELAFDPPEGLDADVASARGGALRSSAASAGSQPSASIAGNKLPSGPEEELDEMIQAGREALEQNERAARIIEAMLTLARVEHIADDALVPCDLRAAVDRAIAEQSVLAHERSIRVHIAAQPDLPSVLGDPELLEQLVGNLIVNALKHGSTPGECWITLEEIDVDGGHPDEGHSDSGRGDNGDAHHGRVRFTVANTGAAISPTAVADLTRPFRRGPVDRVSPSRGHGLGLSIVAAVATHHHADLTLRAREGGGLVVDLAFPQKG